jgi:hypothetical protein
MFANGEERQLGALIEIGCGKQVFVVSPHNWSFQHHPRVRWFDTIAEAVTAIMATAAGVRARRAA